MLSHPEPQTVLKDLLMVDVSQRQCIFMSPTPSPSDVFRLLGIALGIGASSLSAMSNHTVSTQHLSFSYVQVVGRKLASIFRQL